MKYAETLPGGGGSWLFVPDSPFGREEQVFNCKKCTMKYGPPHPNQSGCASGVVSGMC